jgi:hypothetical protein
MRHIPEQYEHAVRSFGLFTPRTIRNRSAAVFTLLESPRLRPKPVDRVVETSVHHDSRPQNMCDIF